MKRQPSIIAWQLRRPGGAWIRACSATTLPTHQMPLNGSQNRDARRQEPRRENRAVPVAGKKD